MGCLDLWNGLQILLSCLHLAIFLFQLNKITRRINTEYIDSESQEKVNIKIGCTSLHILILLTLTINYFANSFIAIFDPNSLISLRLNTVLRLFLGAQDIFVSFMLWFMMDTGN